MTDDFADAFGYRPVDGILPAATINAAEGKDPETLEPFVVVFYRTTPDGPRTGIGMPPEVAEGLADQLVTFARLARERHYE